MRRRLRRLASLTALVVAAGLGLGACGGIVGSEFSTEQGLRDAHFSSVHIGLSNNDVVVSVHVAGPPALAEVGEVAVVVWRHLTDRFDYLQVTLYGTGAPLTQTVSFDEIQRAFGPRSPADNRTDIEHALLHFGEVVVGVLAAVLVLVVVLIVVVVRRRRRPAVASWIPAGYAPWTPVAPVVAVAPGAVHHAAPGPAPSAPVPSGPAPDPAAVAPGFVPDAGGGLPADGGSWGPPVRRR